MANEIRVYTGVKIAGVDTTTDGRMKVDIGGANISATISDISLKNVDVTADNRLRVDSSSPVENFVFADAVTAVGSKTYANNSRKTITVTLLGPGFATFSAKLVSQDSKFAVQGFRETGQVNLVNTGVPGEIITFEKPAGIDLELSWTASTGGAVSARAVIS